MILKMLQNKPLNEQYNSPSLRLIGDNGTTSLYRVLSLDAFNLFHEKDDEVTAQAFGFNENVWNEYCSGENPTNIPYAWVRDEDDTLIGIFLTNSNAQNFVLCSDFGGDMSLPLSVTYEEAHHEGNYASVFSDLDDDELNKNCAPLYLIPNVLGRGCQADSNGLIYNDNGENLVGFFPEFKSDEDIANLNVRESCRTVDGQAFARIQDDVQSIHFVGPLRDVDVRMFYDSNNTECSVTYAGFEAPRPLIDACEAYGDHEVIVAYGHSDEEIEEYNKQKDAEVDQEVVAELTERVSGLGDPEATQDYKGFLDTTYAYYNELTEHQKELAAEAKTKLDQLLAGWEQKVAQQHVDRAIQLIDAIPQEVKYNTASKDALQQAQTQFNALTDSEKELVTNKDILTNGIEKFNLLKDEANHVRAQARANTTKKIIGPLVFEIKNGQAYLTYVKPNSGDVEDEINIPEEVDGYKVTRIESDAFAQKYTTKRINLPDTVRYIGNSAFQGHAAWDISVNDSFTSRHLVLGSGNPWNDGKARRY